jgi:ferredoxin
MTHLVTENCINCKHTDCVSVCPVDCFYEGENFLSINPDECIDCGVCIPECPVDAIVAEEDLDEQQRVIWLEINTRTSQKWNRITRQKDPLPDHEAWNGKIGKIDLLKE